MHRQRPRLSEIHARRPAKHVGHGRVGAPACAAAAALADTHGLEDHDPGTWRGGGGGGNAAPARALTAAAAGGLHAQGNSICSLAQGPAHTEVNCFALEQGVGNYVCIRCATSCSYVTGTPDASLVATGGNAWSCCVCSPPDGML